MFCLVNRLRSFAAVRDYFVGGVLTIGVKASPVRNISLGVHVYNKDFAAKLIQRSGGFTTQVRQRQMIGEIALTDVEDMEVASRRI